MSNFYNSDFIDSRGNKFCCSEQFFMYEKCIQFDPTNTKLLEQILKETNPTKIKALGRKVQNFNNDVWNIVRSDKMYAGLVLKFTQNPKLKQLLLSTGDKLLYEASPKDKIWGIGYSVEKAIETDPKLYGQNLLGIGLMKLRKNMILNK